MKAELLKPETEENWHDLLCLCQRKQQFCNLKKKFNFPPMVFNPGQLKFSEGGY